MTVTSIIGSWKGEVSTTLQQRCRDAWDTPLDQLSDLSVATFLSQKVAVTEMMIEAKRRLYSEMRDGTEHFDGQLAEAVLGANK